jgi:hypothetical protein
VQGEYSPRLLGESIEAKRRLFDLVHSDGETAQATWHHGLRDPSLFLVKYAHTHVKDSPTLPLPHSFLHFVCNGCGENLFRLAVHK